MGSLGDEQFVQEHAGDSEMMLLFETVRRFVKGTNAHEGTPRSTGEQRNASHRVPGSLKRLRGGGTGHFAAPAALPTNHVSYQPAAAACSRLAPCAAHVRDAHANGICERLFKGAGKWSSARARAGGTVAPCSFLSRCSLANTERVCTL